MTDDDYVGRLENALAAVLRPMRGVPFRVVMKALSGQTILQIDQSTPEDRKLLADLATAIDRCGEALAKTPIQRPRPNEVGNDVELYVIKALAEVGFRVERPRSRGGFGKATGYPDILIFDEFGRPTYLECKVYSDDTRDTTMRSFYLSPSDKFKVTFDARHLLLSYEMIRTPLANSSLSSFTPVNYKIIDLFQLDCDMKYEFNADNKRLYSPRMVLMEGRVQQP